MAQLAPSPVRHRRPAHHVARQPTLSLVSRPQTARSSVTTTALLTLVLVAALITMLLLNISMSTTSYEITRLQGQVQSLAEQRQSLEERSELLGTPQELERQARALGMVPAGNVAYIDLARGTIVGEAGVATAADPADRGQSLAPTGDLGARSPYDYGMGNERE